MKEDKSWFMVCAFPFCPDGHVPCLWEWCPVGLTWQRRAGGMNGDDLAISCPGRRHPGTSLSMCIGTAAPVNSRLIPQHHGKEKLKHCR